MAYPTSKVSFDIFELKQLMADFLHDCELCDGDGHVLTSQVRDPGEFIGELFAKYAVAYGTVDRSPCELFSWFSAFSDAALSELLARHEGRPWRILSMEKIEQSRPLLQECKDLLWESIEHSDLNAVEDWLAVSKEWNERLSLEEAIEAAIREHYQSRRAESLSVISSPKLRTLIMERDGAKCRWCGETEGLALDHVLPVAAGGTDDPENLQLLCGSCNSSKGDRVPSQFKERTEA